MFEILMFFEKFLMDHICSRLCKWYPFIHDILPSLLHPGKASKIYYHYYYYKYYCYRIIVISCPHYLCVDCFSGQYNSAKKRLVQLAVLSGWHYQNKSYPVVEIGCDSGIILSFFKILFKFYFEKMFIKMSLIYLLFDLFLWQQQQLFSAPHPFLCTLKLWFNTWLELTLYIGAKETNNLEYNWHLAPNLLLIRLTTNLVLVSLS